jgi:hypothetical protein
VGVVVPGGGRWVLPRARNRGRWTAGWVILGGGRRRVVTSLPSTVEMGSGGAVGVLDLGCSSASAATPEPFLRLTCRWLSTTTSVSAGCPPPASTWGEGRCWGWEAGVVFALQARASHSRSSSSVSRHDKGLLDRLEALEKGLMPRLGSWWPLAAAAAAALPGTAAEPAALEHSARVLEHTTRGSCGGAEPYRPDGYGGQSCAEQSRRPQTFGSNPQTANTRGSVLCNPCQPVLRRNRCQVDRQSWAALQDERPLLAATDANPAAGFWAG